MSTYNNDAQDATIADAIRKVQAGDREAFAVIVRAYQRPLRNWLARSCGPGLDADDLAHRAFITAYQAIAVLDPDSNPLAWLCTIARNHLRDELKTLRRRRTVPVDALAELADIEHTAIEADLDPSSSDEARLVALRLCLQSMPQVMSSLVDLRYQQQLALVDIAEQMGTTVGAIKVRLHTMRRKLHDCVAGRLSVLEAQS